MPSVPNATKSSPEADKSQPHPRPLHPVRRHGLFDRRVRRCQRWCQPRLMPQSELEPSRLLPSVEPSEGSFHTSSARRRQLKRRKRVDRPSRSHRQTAQSRRCRDISHSASPSRERVSFYGKRTARAWSASKPSRAGVACWTWPTYSSLQMKLGRLTSATSPKEMIGFAFSYPTTEYRFVMELGRYWTDL